MLLGEETNAAEVARAKERWGLDQPIYVQYFKFLKSAAAGDFGRSFKYAEPVLRVIMTRCPPLSSSRFLHYHRHPDGDTAWRLGRLQAQLVDR